MDITNVDTKKNTLLGRSEATATVEFVGATPSMADVGKGLAAKLSVDESRVVVKSIYTRYGGGSADVQAYVYDDEDVRKRVEPRVKVKK